MPQDGIKSMGYRSFVTCDDPKGVVDCSTIKISKISSQKMEQKIKSLRTRRNSSKSLASKAEKEELISTEMRERLHGQSSLQLMEVCREAEKLKQVVESWSKGLESDRKSEDLAEDLLEGTLDLKESLIMLGKLQEASKQSACLKEKYQRSSPHQLRDQSFPVEFQRSQLPSHGSSRNGADEIKKVIKDSLVRRHATRNAIGEKSYSCAMNSDSGSEIPSTSSSQSSMVNDNVNCRLVSTTPPKNLKRTNLIAKLMGLEEISSRPMQTTLKKEPDCEKMLGYQRPQFDVDMPNARKSESLINKEVPEKRTLREILETISFKDYKPHYHNTYSKERLKDAPPIVLIKPMHLPFNEMEEYRAHVSLEEEACNKNAMLRRMKMKGLRAFDDFDFHGGILSSKELHKQEAEGIPLKQITQNGRALKHKKVWKSKNGVIDTKKKAAGKLTTSCPMHNHETEPIDKEVLTLKKVTPVNRKPLEKEIVKEKIVSRPQYEDQKKVTSINPRKSKIHTPRGSLSDSVSKRVARALFNDHNCQKKERAALARTVAKSLTHIVEGKKDDGSTDTNESAELPINPNTSTLRSLITMEKGTDECDMKIIECCNESPDSLSDLSPLSPESETDASTAEVNDAKIHNETDIKSCNQGTHLKTLLLSSSLFLSHAEKLFDLNVNDRTMLQASCCNNIETPSTKPYIDCAIELIKRKCHQDFPVAHSLLLGYMSNSKIQISVENLVGEVCNDIEALMRHKSICGENLLVDTLYAVLERDLCCKETMNGMWDFGWKNGFSGNESEQVVDDIEKLIWNGLVEESFK